MLVMIHWQPGRLLPITGSHLVPREAGERQLTITLLSGLFRAHGGASMAQDGRGALVLVAAPFSTGARLLNI